MIASEARGAKYKTFRDEMREAKQKPTEPKSAKKGNLPSFTVPLVLAGEARDANVQNLPGRDAQSQAEAYPAKAGNLASLTVPLVLAGKARDGKVQNLP